MNLLKLSMKTSCFQISKYLFQRNLFTRVISGTMADQRKRAEHLILTANNFRQEKACSAIVQEVFSASKTIKILRLLVDEPGFSFRAGQWVDFFVPGIQQVAGFSITSAPHETENKGIVELAVKYGEYPPTYWVHSQCKTGEEVLIKVGGDFYYDPQPESLAATANLLLVGGGVGINPMLSIVKEYCHIVNTKQNSSLGVKPGKLHLLYSAKTKEELIFVDTLKQLEADNLSVTNRYFITKEDGVCCDKNTKYTRIQEEDIVEALNNIGSTNLLCYVCGPSRMTDDIEHHLLRAGIDKDCIKYEKWW